MFHAVELAQRYDITVKVQPVYQHPLFNKQNYALATPRLYRQPSKRGGTETARRKTGH